MIPMVFPFFRLFGSQTFIHLLSIRSDDREHISSSFLRDFTVLWLGRLILFNILYFEWFWAYFQFSVWFKSQTFIRLTPNRSEDCELVRFCFYWNISNLVGYDLVCVFSIFRLVWNWTVSSVSFLTGLRMLGCRCGLFNLPYIIDSLCSFVRFLGFYFFSLLWK